MKQKKSMRNIFVYIAFVFLMSFLVMIYGVYAAQPNVDFGTAASFGVLGGSKVTNTGSTVIDNNLGVSPGSAITGFPPGLASGTTHSADAVAQQAQSDVTVAYNTLVGLACNNDLTSQDLGGLTLTPGVYCFSSSAQLTGTLTLDGQGNPDAVFIFQIGSTLTTASDSSILLINKASPCNVYWQIGSSATLGTGTELKGNIVALSTITFNTGSDLEGRALARNGAVTLDDNKIFLSCDMPPNTPPSNDTTNNTTPPINSTTNSTTNSTNLTVTKIVINDDEGTKKISDFILKVGDTSVISGVQKTFNAGSYIVSEVSDPGYNATFSGDCNSDGRITLHPGDVKTCIITNNDVASENTSIPEFGLIGFIIILISASAFIVMKGKKIKKEY